MNRIEECREGKISSSRNVLSKRMSLQKPSLINHLL